MPAYCVHSTHENNDWLLITVQLNTHSIMCVRQLGGVCCANAKNGIQYQFGRWIKRDESLNKYKHGRVIWYNVTLSDVLY